MSPARLVLCLILLGCLPPSGAAAATRDLPLTGVPGITADDATLTASDRSATLTAPPVTIDVKGRARVQTCLQVHVLGSPPRVTCEETIAETPDTVPAPTVTREFGPGGTGWVTGFVEVLGRTPDGTWLRIATTWKPGGIADQSLPLTGADEAGTDEPQGVPLEGTHDGGTDTGARDSMCAGTASPAAQPLPAGVTVDALGDDRPAYSESAEPAGPVRGIALVVHGGGWTSHGVGAAEQARPDAKRWQDRGWRSVNATYRPCATSVDDVLWFVDRIRERYGTALPLCVTGQSAGGHLAMLAAALRPEAIDCVSAIAGPGDLRALADQQAIQPGTDQPWDAGPDYAHNLAVAAFGAENLAAFSPATSRIRARILTAVPENDSLVPPAQITGLATAQADLDAPHPVQTAVLGGGGIPFGHGRTSQAELDALHAREDALARAAAIDRGSEPPPVTPTPGPIVVPPASAPPATTARPAASATGLVVSPDPQDVARPLATVKVSAHASLRALAASRPLRVTLRSTRDARATVRIAFRGRTVAKRVVTLAATRSRTVAIRLPRTARRALRKARGTRRLVVSSTVRPRDGRAVTVRRSVRVVGPG